MKKYVFVFGLFIFIGIMIFIVKSRESDVYQEIQSADLSQIENVKFFKDGIRNEGGYLDIPISDKQDLSDFLKILKTIKPSSASLKTLDVLMLYRIQLTLNVEKSRFLTIDIYRCQETVNVGIISIDEGETLVKSDGTYESSELLEWVEKMKLKEGYEEIGGKY
ncbi:MAG: hypothetical protein JXL97_11160 [Bacteroidales bacterium]|nr:hypothetical protein [Bacteroidales bacterium]